jgi:hypothetical protein
MTITLEAEKDRLEVKISELETSIIKIKSQIARGRRRFRSPLAKRRYNGSPAPEPRARAKPVVHHKTRRSKQAAVLAMLSRPSSTTMAATGCVGLAGF